MDSYTLFNLRQTPQLLPASPKQVRNAAGGYTFRVDDAARLRRFLTLGSEGGTYYTRDVELTRDNAAVLFRLAETDHRTLVDQIVEVSEGGLAPRQNPAIFALAVAAAHGDADARAYALSVLPRVCRTGTHLFLFARYIEQFRGWGRGLRRAVAAWYTERDAAALAYQAAKYRQREGWSHRDLLRLSHPQAVSPATRAVFDWICHETVGADTPALIGAFVRTQEPGADVPALVGESGLSWEMLPDSALADPAVWEALLDRGMPQTALLRQLPRLTRLGLLPALGGRTAEVAARLADSDRLRSARVHPVNVLIAQRTYASGASLRGESTWRPTRQIVDALDAAFYAAFGAVEPAGKRTMLALDVSGSMTQQVSGLPLSCREASAALALVQVATEPQCDVVGFTAQGSFRESGLQRLTISPRQRLADAVRAVSDLPFGATDCALPVQEALASRTPVDTFVVYTDNETWAGRTHPHQALREYREKMGIDARMIVVGMTATQCSIADPDDPGMLDVAGFDAGVPSLISSFSRGL
ncbi:TROVE domain-containing protein [Granulicoccus phenolivorans]|uniref:TROVE domain-containing protein n=1 Tax=Granulicoccus phenolivorans TaxID=266854 RepID=UPI00040A2F67|nr:TROVE domain-containing protein [Granulicoccus phenolivorans]